MAAHLFFAFLFVGVLITAHSSVLDLPYFWDELGQFIPAALDIYYDGDWIAKSTLPNVHPPGLMAYLALVWKVFGYSVIVTRVSLLVLAGAGVLFVFHLAVLLCRGVGGLPALSAVLLLLCSPLFFTQSMMAQLDMPAMVFTALALWLFLKDRFALSAAACVLLVLMKETALTTPAVFGAWLLWERRWRQALYFVAPALAVGGWLAYLKAGTGHWLGNKEFTHYNVWFQFHPIRLPLTLIRRAFYLFVDNFHWIGTIVVWLAWRRTRMFYTRAWAVTGTVFVAQVLMVSVFGGAALERYLMPVLPLFYIAVGSGLLALTVPTRRMALGGMAAGLIAAIFLPPVFP
ncbi:MAG TPA: hypothetical protein VEQ63_16315, partial [Bryobacteraceae bacterium]|nr:hypothetical protein [Bryobacteraceae bacterium]